MHIQDLGRDDEFIVSATAMAKEPRPPGCRACTVVDGAAWPRIYQNNPTMMMFDNKLLLLNVFGCFWFWGVQLWPPHVIVFDSAFSFFFPLLLFVGFALQICLLMDGFSC